MADVFVVGAGTTRFGAAGRTVADLAHEAAVAALADAGVRAADVPAVYAGCAGTGSVPAGDGLSLRIGLRRAGLARHDGERSEHAGASGARAVHLAWRAVASGAYEVALCVGAEREPANAPPDAEADPALGYRCDAARRYMAASGATVEQLARAAAKNLRNGARNPAAPYAGADRHGDAVAAVLHSEIVAWPLTRLMLARPAAGAAAIVFASAGARRRLGLAGPRVLASILLSEAAAGADGDGGGDEGARAAALAYRTAAVGPEDVDCAEVHDDTAAAELAAYEALQFVPEGQGPELIDTGFTSLGGVLPVNTSGGLLALGELAGGSAVAQLCELAAQLRGDAGGRQVTGARIGLAHARGPGEDGRRLVGVTLLGPA